MRNLLKFIFNNKTEVPVEPKPCTCYGKVNLITKKVGKIDIHPSVVLNSNPEGYHVGMPFETTLIADKPGALIKIGENTRIHGSYIHAWKSIEIGRGVLIGAGTNIVDSNGHSSDIRYARFRRNFQDTAREIRIHDFVWIGLNCIILKGVEIGEGAIIAAGSVVKNNIPPFSIAEGNPAKVIRQFNPKEALGELTSLEILKNEEGFYEY